jgi:hypothetical protein
MYKNVTGRKMEKTHQKTIQIVHRQLQQIRGDQNAKLLET